MPDEHFFTVDQPDVIAEQARKVRALYPELFAALDQRDRRLQRATYRIPHPADPETMVQPQTIEQALLVLRTLDPGIGRLCEESH